MDVYDLVSKLHGLNWARPWAMPFAQAFLRAFWASGDARKKLADYLALLQYPEPAITRTAELHSWKLHRTPIWDLALNQFLPFMEGRQASENIHNHTRPLASLTLCGGYTQKYYQLLEPLCEYRDGEPWEGRIASYPGPITYPGTVYLTSVEVFHALTSFEPGTMTLVVYGPLKQPCTLCFNQLTGLVERRRTVSDAKAALIETLRSS